MSEKILATPAPLIGAQLRKLRSSKGMSLSDLSRHSGTSPSALHRYESGWGQFELGTLRRLAAALGARLAIGLEPVRDPTPQAPETVDEVVTRLRPLFWDVDLTPTHLRENAQWVLRRVLQFGDWEQVHCARLFFGDEAVRRAAAHRSMDVRTRRFWQVVLGPDGEGS